MCPIFQISNVTGENMDLLKMFLNLLSSRTTFKDDEPPEFQIDDTYSVPVNIFNIYRKDCAYHNKKMTSNACFRSTHIAVILFQTHPMCSSGRRDGSIRNYFTRIDTS